MTHQELYTRAHELLTYKDGCLYWKTNRKGAIAVKGARAGSLSKSSYYRGIYIDNRRYIEHRIIFLMHHGYLTEMIDHINCIKTDNRIENLRASDRCTNQQNTGAMATGCGLKGARYDKSRDLWMSSIRVYKKRIFLGRFKTKEEAHEAYKAAALKYHGEFASF